MTCTATTAFPGAAPPSARRRRLPAVTIGADSNPGVTDCAGTRAAAINPERHRAPVSPRRHPRRAATIPGTAAERPGRGAGERVAAGKPRRQSGHAGSSRTSPMDTSLHAQRAAAGRPRPSIGQARGRAVPRPAAQRKSASRRADAPASPYQVQISPVSGQERLHRDGQGAADPGGAALPGRCRAIAVSRWQLLAACDWMQCAARSRYSPVHGEKLGTRQSRRHELPDEVSRRSNSAPTTWSNSPGRFTGSTLTAPGDLSVRDLANVFAAFRWGGLLKLHRTSAMEFPYSVAGLTEQYSQDALAQYR